MKIQPKYLVLLAVSGALIAIDQLTKTHILTKFSLGESIAVIQDWFNITYVRNYGAAFGFMAESHPQFRDMFFLMIPPIALVFILGILKGVENEDKVQILALSSIFGGAIGNYIDRLRFGFVVDFLDWHYKGTWSYPTFNFADMCIVVGVCVLLLLMALPQKNISQKKGA